MSEKLENLAAMWAKTRERALPASASLVYSTQSTSVQKLDKKTSLTKVVSGDAEDLLRPADGVDGGEKSGAKSGANGGANGGAIRVRRETKGRGGKAVSVITGLVLADAQLLALGKELKALCGSGGTVKDGVIEVQGDHVDRIVQTLISKGFKAKRSGG